MQVLLTELITADSIEAATRLQAAGHTVVTCHEHGDTGTACAALRGQDCPLEAAPVDVAVTVRSAPVEDRLPLEEGVRCAVRLRVPLVVAGATAMHPFGPWAAAQSEGTDVVAAVEDVAARPMAEHGAVAAAAVRASQGEAVVQVWRRDGGLRVVLTPAAAWSQREAHAAAVRAAGALKAFDPSARSIDVSVAPSAA